MLGDHRRGDHHSDGDKEYRSEKILDRLHNVVNMFAFRSFGENGSHDEGSESGRETDRCGQCDHSEAEADADNKENLVVEIFLGLFQQGRNDVDSHEEPQDQEEDEFGDVHYQLLAGEGLRDRHC